MRMKRFLAGLLCFCLIGTSDVFYTNAAALGSREVTEEGLMETEDAEPSEKTEEEEIEEKTSVQAEKNTEDGKSESGQKEVIQEKMEQPQEAVESQKEQPKETVEDQKEQPWFDYAVVASPVVTLPGTQKVLLGIGDENISIERAVLHYIHETTGEVYKAEVQEISADGLLFSMDFTEKPQAGSYLLTGVEYWLDGEEQELLFADAGMEMRFGVNTEVETSPDSLVVEDEALNPDIDVVTMDENGNTTSASSIHEAIQNVASDMAGEASKSRMSVVQKTVGASQLVVVLDPGHDASHPGSVGNGLQEKDLNLKIAQYCKKELETYSGVKVYMTRTGDACPFGGNSVTDSVCLPARADFAASVKANVFVSIHNNAGGGKGAEIYYPNANYRPGLSTTGKNLAQSILNKLVELGIANRGVKIRDSASGDSYADGTLMDYYGVIRRCKNNYNIPAIIVEHAFVDSSDAKNFLNSDAKLKKLGVADATGIAQYYGLKKAGTSMPKVTALYATSRTSGGVTVKWNKVAGATKYIVARRKAGESSFVQVGTVGNQDYFVDTSVKTGKNYYYKVKASSGGGYGSYGNEVTGIELGKPTVSYVKSVDTGTLKVAWKQVAKAEYYQVYRSTSKNGKYTKVSETTGLSYTNKNRTPGKTYYYKVRAVRKVATKVYSYSNYSEPKSAKSLSAPKISSVISKGSKLEVFWGSVSGASYYQLYRSESKSGTYKYVSTVKGKSYEDTSIKKGKTYYYKVRAVNKSGSIKGYSSYSSAKSGKTLVKVTNLTVRSYSSNQHELKWGAVSGAKSYEIYRTNSSTGKFTKIGKTSSVSYIDKKASTGKKFYYKVRALEKKSNKTGYGIFSDVKSCRTLAKTQPVSIRSVTSSQLEIKWGAVNTANRYEIHRSTSKNGTYKKIGEASGTSYIDENRTEGKTYYYKIRALKVSGSARGKGSLGTAVSGKTLKKVSGVKTAAQSDGNIKVSWSASSGASQYQVARSKSKNGSYTVIKKINGTSFIDSMSASVGDTYYYKVRAVNVVNGKKGYGTYSEPKSAATGYAIMGGSGVTVAQMAVYYRNFGKSFPASVYAAKGAGSIDQFCQIVLEEANAEGVRAEVLFAQICLETGFLQFGGDVNASQCNFGGLGATGGGVAGNVYPDVRTGIRAQVQHLKAYASTAPLNQACVDNRFQYVSRGCAPFVQWLGIPDNPYGKGWAAAKGYGYNLMNMIRAMKGV